MRVAVIVPWRGGCPDRERARTWVADRLHRALDAVVWFGQVTDGPWIKAQAVNPLVRDLDHADVLVVSDADVWCENVTSAVEAVVAGAAWAIPHDRVHRLTPEATHAVLDGLEAPEQPGNERLVERPYRGVAGGGLVVARRDVLLDVPLDPRFVGWGGEDEAWGYALKTLHGAPWRPAPTRRTSPQPPLVHFWHPPQERRSRSHGSRENDLLRGRYDRARRSPDAMRAVLGEVFACP